MSQMLLFNIGNTHTQWVFSDIKGNFIGEIESLPSAAWQQDLTLLPSADSDTQVWAACVVPAAREVLQANKVYGQLHWINTENAAEAGLDFSQVDSSTLGADRIANAAALLQYELPAANFDCGTAITLEVVMPGGIFAGGAIAPGRKLMRCSLAAGTAALPELPIAEAIPTQLGINTLQALALGIDGGSVGVVRELMRVAQQRGVRTFVASGGDAEFFCRGIKELSAAGCDFTLHGVAQIASVWLGKHELS